jgi:hypothetical protein
MSTATSTDRESLRQIWHAGRERQQTKGIDEEALAQQLAVIDKRISRASASAATSNRARGAVRAWTQRRAALVRSAAESAHPAQAGDAAAEQAEKLLIAGAPQHLRVEESLARQAVAQATKRLAELDPESLPADFKRAREVLEREHTRHRDALLAAINWEPGA